MFKIFTGKLNNTLSLAWKINAKTTGSILNDALDSMHTTLNIINTSTNQIQNTLTSLPIIGTTIEKGIDIQKNSINKSSDILQDVSNNLIQNSIPDATKTIIAGTTSMMAAKTTEIVKLIATAPQDIWNSTGTIVEDTASFITEKIKLTKESIHGVGDILESVITDTIPNIVDMNTSILETTINLSKSAIDDIQDTKAFLKNPKELTVSKLIQDKGISINDFLSDISPLTEELSTYPIIGDILNTPTQVSKNIGVGIYEFGMLVANYADQTNYHPLYI